MATRKKTPSRAKRPADPLVERLKAALAEIDELLSLVDAPAQKPKRRRKKTPGRKPG
jgi:hypothetical protein